MKRSVMSDAVRAVVESTYEALDAICAQHQVTMVLQLSLESAGLNEAADGVKITLAQIIESDFSMAEEEPAGSLPNRDIIPLDRNDASGCLHRFAVYVSNELDNNGNLTITFSDEFQQVGRSGFNCANFMRTYGLEKQPVPERRLDGWARVRQFEKVGGDIMSFLYQAHVDEELLPAFSIRAK
mgnify:CR=1 FL=1